LDRDIGSRAHGDADIGGGERWRVVDPVGGHRDDPSLLAQPLDDFALVLREDFGTAVRRSRRRSRSRLPRANPPPSFQAL
jgi:hypothetical protein